MTTATSELLPGYYLHEESGSWRTIPWPADPSEKLTLLERSIGPQIIAWAEGRTDEPGLLHPLTGEPWRYTDGQKRFLILWYSVTESGRWAYRSGVKRGAKGTGKDPFGGSWCLIEFIGPARFAGFDAHGRPIGERHRMPLVQIAANSEAQAKDVLRIANAMLSQEAREHYGIDPGETRTILTGTGGRIELLTASEKSSEGDPATAIMLNESHHMTESSGGHAVAAVARRNIGKSPREIQARLVEFTNAHHNGQESVAEKSFEAWQAQVTGKAKRRDILYDSIEAPADLDVMDDAQRMAGLAAAYSDAPWADLERLEDEVLDHRTSLADSIRYYFNGLGTAEDAWIDPRNFAALAAPGTLVAAGELISMFLDCSKSGDATALVAARISDGYVFTLGIWQRPHGWDQKKHGPWLVSRELVEAEVHAAFAKWRPVWFGIDPSPAKDDDAETLYWAPMIDRIHRRYRARLKVWATPGARGHSVKFDMRLSQPGGVERNRMFTEAAQQVAHDIDEEIPVDQKTLRHDGDALLVQHTNNARRRPNQWGVSLSKVSRDSSNLVDGAVSMVGALMGRQLYLNAKSTSTTGRSRRAAKNQKVVVLR